MPELARSPKILLGGVEGSPSTEPPPIPDEGGALGGFALLCSTAFSVAVAGALAFPIPVFLLLALVGAPVAAGLGGVLGLISIFSRSARNRRGGLVSMGLVAVASGVVAFVLF